MVTFTMLLGLPNHHKGGDTMPKGMGTYGTKKVDRLNQRIKEVIMFAEVLTGIALVRSSVSFIKENIQTCKDVSEMIQSVDSLLEGEDQINKDRSKKDGVTIKDQLGIKGVAHEVIDAKLAAEMRWEMRVLIDNRFGAGTFPRVL